MTDNLKLWNSVERTDPNQVKPITGKSYQGSSPKPHYLIHKATETFGPIGIGWGFMIVDERIEEGAGGEKMSIARVCVWYKWEGERGEVEHVGGTPFSGMRSSGKPFTDEDAPKKSVTDALVKALSMIGFAGDIFMGLWDDAKYVQELKDEAKAPEQPKPEEPKRLSKDASRSSFSEVSEAFRTAETLDALDAAGKRYKPKINEMHAEFEAELKELFKSFRADLQAKPKSTGTFQRAEPDFSNLDNGYGPGDYTE